MARPRGRCRAWVRFAVAAAGVAAGWSLFPAAEARADRIVLRGGGQVRGKVLPDPEHADRLTVLTDRGKTPLSFRKEQITQVVPEASALDDYLTRRAAAPATAEAQYELGVWCERHKLQDLAEVHFASALRLDKAYDPALRKLGYVKSGDRWLKGDELKEAQGLVRDRGRWVTREEKDQRDKDRAAAAEETSWARRVRLLRDAILGGSDDRRREAETQLMEVRDPAAVRPLVRVLGAEEKPLRLLLARALGVIPGPEATRALVYAVVGESDPDVRLAALGEAENRDDPEVGTLFARALQSGSPQVVNRAAWALGRLNAVSTVPGLVAVLVTTRTETVMGPAAVGPGEGQGIAATFGSVPPSSPAGGTPIAYNGSSIGYLNGVAVGPGVAAYGASSVPYYPLPNPLATLPGGLGASFGASNGIPAGGGLSASRGPTPRLITVAVRNTEVHAALVKLTGEDFGFDVPAWKRWVRFSFRPDPTPARRVPQP